MQQGALVQWLSRRGQVCNRSNNCGENAPKLPYRNAPNSWILVYTKIHVLYIETYVNN